MELHFVELPKFKTKPRGMQTRLEKWSDIIKFGEKYAKVRSLSDEPQSDEIIVRALKKPERMNADEKMLAILEQCDNKERTRLT